MDGWDRKARAAAGGQGKPVTQQDEQGGKSKADESAEPAAGPRSWLQRAVGLWRDPAYRFVMLFLPYLGAVSIFYPIFVKRHHDVVQAFILMTVKVEYALFWPFTSAITTDEKLIDFAGFSVKIIDECTGIYEMLIYSAAVLAFPTSWKKRGVGLLLGNPLIYLFNVLRIAMLIVVGRYWSDAFDFMHLYFWQATMILMITSVWLLWILEVVRSEEVPAAPAA